MQETQTIYFLFGGQLESPRHFWNRLLVSLVIHKLSASSLDGTSSGIKSASGQELGKDSHANKMIIEEASIYGRFLPDFMHLFIYVITPTSEDGNVQICATDVWANWNWGPVSSTTTKVSGWFLKTENSGIPAYWWLFGNSKYMNIPLRVVLLVGLGGDPKV